MKKIKHLIYLVATALAIAGCLSAGPPAPTPSGGINRDYDGRRDRDTDRRGVLENSKRRYSDSSDCKGDEDCEEICEDIYNRRRDREDCEDLSLAQVKRLEEIYDFIEDPDEDELDTISGDDFDTFININIYPLDRLVGKYKRSEAEEMLLWIARNDEIAKIFKKEDDDYKILKDLLKELNGSNDQERLKRSIDDDNFLGMISENGNEEAGEWVHDFIEDELCSGDLVTEECLGKYCDIANAMDEDNAEGLGSFEYFEDYLQDIIDDGINGDTDTSDGSEPPTGNQWDNDPGSDDQIQRADDLGKWWEDAPRDEGVCKNGAVGTG